MCWRSMAPACAAWPNAGSPDERSGIATALQGRAPRLGAHALVAAALKGGTPRLDSPPEEINDGA